MHNVRHMTSLPSQRGEQGTDHTLESTMLFDNSVTDHGRGLLYWWGTENKSNKTQIGSYRYHPVSFDRAVEYIVSAC